MPIRSCRFWNLTPEEVLILSQASVIEKYQNNRFKEDSPELFELCNSKKATEILKKAYKTQERADKEAIRFINKQEPWIRNAMLNLFEEEKAIYERN